jgi:hypothetical protein
MSASDAINNQMQCPSTPQFATSVEMQRAQYRRGGMLSGNPGGGGGHQPFSTSKGLSKGSDGIPTLLPPFYFHVVSLTSCIKVSFIDKKMNFTPCYTLLV